MHISFHFGYFDFIILIFKERNLEYHLIKFQKDVCNLFYFSMLFTFSKTFSIWKSLFYTFLEICLLLFYWYFSCFYIHYAIERLLLNHSNTPGFLAPRGEEFNLGPETRLDRSELLCNKVLLKYKGDRESFWHRHQKGAERVPPC